MTISLDFDGVIHQYSKGWNGGEIYDEAIKGAKEFIDKLLADGYSVFILSTRDSNQIIKWFNDPKYQIVTEFIKFWNYKGIVGVTNRKLPAHIYIDDRAYKFQGRFDDSLLHDIKNFKTWQER